MNWEVLLQQFLEENQLALTYRDIMKEEKFTLQNLKDSFLQAHKNQFYRNMLNTIYDIYEKEFLILFDDFFAKLLESYDPDKKENIEQDLFKYDIMQNICTNINYMISIFKLRYEFDMNFVERQSPIALVEYWTEEELEEKVKYLEQRAEKEDILYYAFYVDKRRIKAEIEGLLLLPNILISMTDASTSQLNEDYKMRLEGKDEIIMSMEEDAAHGNKFKGGKLTEEKKRMYEEILDIRTELERKFEKGHKSSLTKATEIYLKQTGSKYPNKKTIKNIASRIGDLESQGRIEDNKIIF